MASNDAIRKLKEAPCGFEGTNSITKNTEIYYPPINCEFKCDQCGWNPAVAKRRIEKAAKGAKLR